MFFRVLFGILFELRLTINVFILELCGVLDNGLNFGLDFIFFDLCHLFLDRLWRR